MPVAEDERTENGGHGGASASKTALTAAAAAAATGAATYAIKKARSHNGDRDDDEGRQGRSSKQKGGAGSLVSDAASSAWESASAIVLPVAEDAVAAAGRYLAESAPDVVRERLVPRFIDAFNEAS